MLLADLKVESRILQFHTPRPLTDPRTSNFRIGCLSTRNSGRQVMANCNNNSEPSSAPASGIWYNLTLGSSYKENPSTKFCTLRYEFKPASIDKSQAGSLHKNKENRVSLEFQNNQHGKPKVVFEGSSEDYKKNDGVLFFNGDSFRLERLHRSVKRLRHVRMPGESAAASSSLNAAATNSPPLGKMPKASHSSSKAFVPAVPVLIEKIDIGEPDSPGAKPTARTTENPSSFPSKVTSSSPGKRKNTEQEDHYSLIFGDDDNEEEEEIPDKKDAEGQGPDMNIIPNHDSDDEIADVDVSDDVEGNGLNAAEALRAQVNAEEQQQTSSSSGSGSSSSGSGSDSGSGSGSGSSSSGSEASDDDSASSGGDVDI